MKVKLDENLPEGLLEILKQHGYEGTTVPRQGLAGQPDSPVWQTVQRERVFFVTMDLHFSDIRQYPPGTHEGIMLLRLARQGRKAILEIVQRVLTHYSLNAFKGCIVVADESRIRVRRPIL